MDVTNNTNCNLLADISIITQFQPIVSIKRKSFVGVEALSRGVSSTTNEIIPPLTLFEHASNNINDLIRLDRLCRESALINFKQIKKENKDMLLFVNIESSILDTVCKSNYLIERVLDVGINPCDIVLEINESKINNIDALICFANRYRELGFLIAIDDIGAGFSNLNRIPMLNPDIIKIDRFILKNINEDHYKAEVFKSLISLASNTGSLVVAEGIETREEALLASELGADMMQGFFFSRPVSKLCPQAVSRNILSFIEKYKTSMDVKNKTKKQLINKLKASASKVLESLCDTTPEYLEKTLKNATNQKKDIECVYVLNKSGMQISKTVFKHKFKRKNESVLFLPACKGTDHSLKGYYYHLVNNNNKIYISDKYMSMATGNMCITLSEIFYDASGLKNILCIDFLAQ